MQKYLECPLFEYLTNEVSSYDYKFVLQSYRSGVSTLTTG